MAFYASNGGIYLLVIQHPYNRCRESTEALIFAFPSHIVDKRVEYNSKNVNGAIEINRILFTNDFYQVYQYKCNQIHIDYNKPFTDRKIDNHIFANIYTNFFDATDKYILIKNFYFELDESNNSATLEIFDSYSFSDFGKYLKYYDAICISNFIGRNLFNIAESNDFNDKVKLCEKYYNSIKSCFGFKYDKIEDKKMDRKPKVTINEKNADIRLVVFKDTDNGNLLKRDKIIMFAVPSDVVTDRKDAKHSVPLFGPYPDEMLLDLNSLLFDDNIIVDMAADKSFIYRDSIFTTCRFEDDPLYANISTEYFRHCDRSFRMSYIDKCSIYIYEDDSMNILIDDSSIKPFYGFEDVAKNITSYIIDWLRAKMVSDHEHFETYRKYAESIKKFVHAKPVRDKIVNSLCSAKESKICEDRKNMNDETVITARCFKYANSGVPVTMQDLANELGNLFEIKDIKFSGPKVIVFWKDNTKTIVTMQDDEQTYDVEKAIFAAYMKKALSLSCKPSRQRSIDNILDKWVAKFKEHEAEVVEQIKKVNDRKNGKKKSSTKKKK